MENKDIIKGDTDYDKKKSKKKTKKYQTKFNLVDEETGLKYYIDELTG
jgi:hypothetical protein